MHLAQFTTRLVAATSIVALLAHTFLGCCWHHAHPVETSGGGHAGAVAHAGDHHHAHHQHDSHGDTGEQPHDQGCDEPDCAYVAAASPQVIDGAGPFDAPLAVAALPSSLNSGSAAKLWIRDPAMATSTARLRAELQIWVI